MIDGAYQDKPVEKEVLSEILKAQGWRLIFVNRCMTIIRRFQKCCGIRDFYTKWKGDSLHEKKDDFYFNDFCYWHSADQRIGKRGKT